MKKKEISNGKVNSRGANCYNLIAPIIKSKNKKKFQCMDFAFWQIIGGQQPRDSKQRKGPSPTALEPIPKGLKQQTVTRI